MGIQSFGDNFNREKFYHAREVARDITHELSSFIRPGMTEADAHKLYKDICKKHPVQKQWHPPKLRFGPNTLKNFRDESVPYEIQEEDIFFIDIGPVIENHEADYGETFTLGSIFEQKRISQCSRKIFYEVQDHWRKNRTEGEILYQFAKERSLHYGYTLNLGSDGHRIGDFPHHIFFKGGLNECEEVVVPDAWILEIHLFNQERTFGAFFEDILTDSDF